MSCKVPLTRKLACRVLALAALAASIPACGGDEADLTIYSGRNERLVGPLFERFEEETGLDVEIRYGDSAELAATIAEEGENSPADVFFAQDAGSLGSVAEEGLLVELPASLLEKVDSRFRDPDRRWVGTSGRARVIAYNTDALSANDLPETIWAFADGRWSGRVGFPPTNASFQAMVTAMRLAAGEERTRRWLEAIRANDPNLYENNIQTVEAIAAGEVDVGFVNHYYLYDVLREQPGAPVANHFLRDGDAGALVNAAGVGIITSTDARSDAERFVEYLLSDGQRFFAEETAEYPLVEGVQPDDELPPLATLQGPQLELGALGPQLAETLELLNDVGLTS